jgi:hypothetical protein
LDKSRVILSLILVSTALTLAFYAFNFLATPEDETRVLAPSTEKTLHLSYDDGSSKQVDLATHSHGADKIIPISSSVGYDYSGSRGISVQQNVTQQNVCSSNTAYCYNEIDNDFNVNPP